MARRAVYAVIPQDDGWAVERDGRVLGKFPRKEQAVDSAKALASDQKAARLLIKSSDGRIQSDHTYDQRTHHRPGEQDEIALEVRKTHRIERVKLIYQVLAGLILAAIIGLWGAATSWFGWGAEPTPETPVGQNTADSLPDRATPPAQAIDAKSAAIKDTVVAQESKPTVPRAQKESIREGRSAAFFDGEVLVSIESISFEGVPGHYVARGRVAVGEKSFPLEGSAGFLLTTPGGYRVTLLGIDALWTEFSVTRPR